MTEEVRGLVIRTTDINESDRLVTIFTEQKGVVTALAKGARSLKSRKMASTMQFCYGDFVLVPRGDKFWIKETSLIESFFDIRSSLEGLALAGYVVEVLADVAVAEAELELLRLCLNSLYAIASGKYSLNKVKAAFEIRAASILGFMPDVLSCQLCDEKHGEFFFNVMGGFIECFKCHSDAQSAHTEVNPEHESHIVCILSESAKIALGYCIHTPLERLFSFNIPDEDMLLLSRATEEYLVNHLERSFKTLEFYKEISR
jgi:DNA repair protein RecO (recombination protein O)